ncbi:hypothetical protein KP509_12G033600 [Ceratopteris richardii]|nr:hypothetical protein KP509_12G033600 [Ceratopteris richardii]
MMMPTPMKHGPKGVHLWSCLAADSCRAKNSLPVASQKLHSGWAIELLCKCSRKGRFSCHAAPEGVNDDKDDVDKEGALPDRQGSAVTPVTLRKNGDSVIEYNTENRGRSGFVSFFSPVKNIEELTSEEVEQQGGTRNEAWISVLWVLGPAVLVSSVVLPPFFLRKAFELLLEDSLVTDFLILFFTETLFYAGVFVFLLVAHKVQQATGVFTWNSGSRSSWGYKISTYITMTLAVLLPLTAFAFVWPWTGPAAAAALLPYVAGLAVQYGFEQLVQEKKWSVWPLIPIVFQVYRLHQLNRATQLVAGLLYSLRGAEATAETLAVNTSLQTLVTVLQLLGMLCLWALSAYLTHVFSSESLDWQPKVFS